MLKIITVIPSLYPLLQIIKMNSPQTNLGCVPENHKLTICLWHMNEPISVAGQWLL